MISVDGEMVNNIFRGVALVFAIMYSVKMIGWLLGLDQIKSKISTLYDSKLKRYIYLVIFLGGSLLLLTKLNIAEYAVAVLTIGALYDYFFTLFPRASGELVKVSMENKSKMWFFGILFPSVMAVSVILYLIIG